MARRSLGVSVIGLVAVVVGLVLIGPLALAARAGLPAAHASAPAATISAAPPLVIVASLSVLGDLVGQVAGEVAPVAALVGPGIEPHDVAPAPADAATIATADVLFVNGLGLEGWLDDLVASAGRPGLRIVTLSAGLPTIHLDGDETAAGNPHLWLDPSLTMAYVATIRDTLGDLDPANRPTYEANATRYLDQLRDLDQAIAAAIATIAPERRMLITFHDAWPYFAARYGLRHIAVHPANPEADLTAQEYAALIDLVRREQAPVVIGEAGFNPKLMQQLARDTGVVFVDGLHGDTLADSGPAATYLGMMRHDVSLIVDALR